MPLQRAFFILSLCLCPIFLSPFYARRIVFQVERGDMITQTILPKTVIPDLSTERPPRIIVLVPEAEIDPAHAAMKISEIATTTAASVQFIGLSADLSGEPALRRQMATLSAFLETDLIPVRSRVEIGSNWLNALRMEWRTGDIIVCFAGVPAGMVRKPLSQLLESSLEAVIYVIDGLPHQAPPPSSGRWSSVAGWSGSLVILLGMFWLQVDITHVPAEGTRTLLLCVSVFIEFGLIWLWNSLFG
jgi:hypothetical protein